MSMFGEIVEPISRVAWEDWDDIIPERTITQLKWQRNYNVPNNIGIFYLFEGKYLSDCVQTQCNLELINSMPTVNLFLYKMLPSNNYVCVVKNYDLLLSSEIVELLWQYLTASDNIITIQTKPLSEYQTTILSSQDCIIRRVCTSKSAELLDIDFPKLEQPNLISGVSAGVISLRDHLNKPGTALVCYIEHPEEYHIGEMQRLLDKFNIQQSNKSRPSSVLNSNLYI